MKLYAYARENMPKEKIIFFSSSLKFLDIVAEVFRRIYQVDPIRFDGTVPTKRRKDVERSFETCGAEIPLLITMNAGKSVHHKNSESRLLILEGDIKSPFWAEQHRIMQGVRNECLRKIDSGWRPGPNCRGFHDFIPEVELKPAPKPVAT
jgi:hypothetical protein